MIQQPVYNKDAHIAQLEAVNSALADKLAFLNKRNMKKHDAQSLKWRDRAFYYKKRVDSLITYIEGLGLKVPKTGGV